MEKSFEEVAQIIADNGGRMYLVGGAVRDMLMNKESHDMDFCVTGLSIDEFKNAFPDARIQGKDFSVFIINGCEFALARKERKIGEKHTDFEILADKSITIEEDLSRRDLTINGMAIDFLTKELIDPFGGAEDIKNKTLRMTTYAFSEDPLRVYRVARFSSQLGFQVENHTLEVMNEMKNSLSNLSSERVCAEFRRALIANKPSLFFDVLREANVLEVHFKEIYDLIGVEQPLKYHPEGDVYNHTMEVLDKAANMTSDELTRFCALVHDFGKASTPRDIWPHHYGHEEAGIELVKNFCRRLKLPNVFEKAGRITCKYHMMAGRYDTLKPSTKIKMFETVYSSKSISYEGLEIVAKCDSKDNTINFANTAREIMKINATKEMMEKCGFTEGKAGDFEKLKQLIRQERVSELKKIERTEIE